MSVAPSSLHRIETCGPLGWVQAQLLHELNGAILDHWGSESYIGFWARLTNVASASSLMSALNEAARRIFGEQNPRGLVKWVGRAWRQTSRNIGYVDTEELPNGSVLVTQAEVPESCRHLTVALALHGALQGTVSSTGCSPTIDHELDHFRSDGVARFRVSW